MQIRRISRSFALLGVASLCLLVLAGSAAAAAGDLDPGFTSFPGRVVTPIGSGDEVANGVAVQSNGKIVAAGYSDNGVDLDFAVTRYGTTGSLNASFGTGGIVTTDFGSGDDRGTAVKIQSDGKIVVAGYASNGADFDFAVARYDLNGVLDPGFDGDGLQTIAVGAGNDKAFALLIQPDGKIVLAGSAVIGGDLDFALVRLNTDGSLDTSFSTDGIQTLDVGGGANADEAFALVRQDNGKLTAAGYAYNGATDDFALARFLADGTVATGFGTGGKVITSFGGGDDIANGLVLQTDGKLVAAGTNGSDFAFARYVSGVLDTSFSTDGKQTVDFTGVDVARGLVLQSDGKLVAAGSNDSGTDFAIARLTTTGVLDTTFSTDGKQTTDFTATTDQANALTLQSDGKLVAAGSAYNGSDDDFGLARYLGS
jgi:uncharacterized delta-60 repeat protein